MSGVLLNPNKKVYVDEDQVISAVDALFKLNAKKDDQKRLFDEEREIFMQVIALKVPKCPNRTIKFPLLHSLLTPESDICLITADLKDSDVKDHDKAIEHYEKLLAKHDITNIKTIMPVHQLATEYDQFELKRRLVDLYDHFLVEGKVSGKVAHLLGKVFKQKRKLPASVKMDAANLKSVIEFALRKVNFEVHSKGDSFLMQIAHTEMPREEIVNNIIDAASNLDKHFPGGWDNVRALYIRTRTSMSLPVYCTLKNKSEVKVPVVKAKRPKNFVEYRGELTTRPGKEVIVYPTGKVVVQEINKEGEASESEDEENLDVFEDESGDVFDEESGDVFGGKSGVFGEKGDVFEEEGDVFEERGDVFEERGDVFEAESGAFEGGKGKKGVKKAKDKKPKGKKRKLDEDDDADDVLAKAEEAYLNENEMLAKKLKKERKESKREEDANGKGKRGKKVKRNVKGGQGGGVKVKSEAVAGVNIKDKKETLKAHKVKANKVGMKSEMKNKNESKNVNAESKNVNVQGKNVNAERKNVNAERKNANAERKNANAERKNVNAERKNVNVQKKNANAQRKNVNVEKKTKEFMSKKKNVKKMKK